MNIKLTLACFILFLFASCNSHVTVPNVSEGTGGAGTAEGFGGDGPHTDKLVNIRDTIIRPTVNYLVQGGGNPSQFCNFAARCPDAQNPLCTTVLTLTVDQMNNCSNFLFRNLQSLGSQLASSNVTLEATYDPLIVNGVEVAAMTNLAAEGKIQVNIAHMDRLSDVEIVSLLVHEYFHKIQDLLYGFIQDLLSYPQFPQAGEIPLQGASLNTSAGLEIGFQAQGLNLVPNPVPPDPSGLSSISTVNSLALTWKSNGGATEAFQIAYAPGNVAPANCLSGTVVLATTIGNATSYTISGLAADSPYSVRVCAVGSSLFSTGLTLTASTLPIITLPPPNPSALQATPTLDSIRLTWASGGGTTQSFQIAYTNSATAPVNCSSGSVIAASTVGNSVSYSITGLSSDANYSFRVCAQASGIFSDGLTITTKTLKVQVSTPPNPSSPIATPTYNSIQLTWTSGGSNTETFQIAYSNSGTAPANCSSGTVIPDSVIQGSTSYNLTGLSSSSAYSFRICAQGSGLLSSGITLSSSTTAQPKGDLVATSAIKDNPNNTQALSGTTVDFGEHFRFTTTTAVVTLTNMGNAPVSGGSASVPGDGPYQITNSTCNTVAIGATCTITVTFRATTQGTFSRFLTFSYNDGVGSVSKTLSLIGKTPAG